MVEAIPLYSSVEVTVAATPPSCMGKVDEVVAPESPGGGVHDSPAWSELEEDEGAALMFADVVTETGDEGLRLEWTSVSPRRVVLQHSIQHWGQVRSGQWSLSPVCSTQRAGQSGSGCGPTLATFVRLNSSYALSGRRSFGVFLSKAGSRLVVSSPPQSRGLRKPFVGSRSLGGPYPVNC
jgi:hypothetical protein